MTAAPNPTWQATDDNNRPVHNATLTILRAEDRQKVITYLDPALTRIGANPRYSNLGGWFCNSAADGTVQPVCLPPGNYIADMQFPPSGKRVSGGRQIAFTVPAGQGATIQITGALVEPAKHTQTVVVHAGAQANGRDHEAHVIGDAQPAVDRTTSVHGGASKPPSSNISAAIGDLEASIRERRRR